MTIGACTGALKTGGAGRGAGLPTAKERPSAVGAGLGKGAVFVG